MSFLTAIVKTVAPLLPEKIVNWTAREYFNHRLNSFGTMTTLHIDSVKRRAAVDLELKGETQPLHITIDRYEVTKASGKTFIEIQEITTSREWLTLLAQQMVKGKKFEVPELVASVL